jgi:uncharacterized protein
MRFSWNESKRLENLEKRKVDFREAALIFEDPKILEIVNTRSNYGEQRFCALGQTDGDLCVRAPCRLAATS